MTVAQVEEILALPTNERLRLMEVILESVRAEQASNELTDREREIVEERLTAYRAEPENLLTWDEVKERAFGG